MRDNIFIKYVGKKISNFFSTLLGLFGIFILFFVFLCLFDMIGNIGESKIELYPNLVGAAFETLFLYAVYNLVKPFEK